MGRRLAEGAERYTARWSVPLPGQDGAATFEMSATPLGEERALVAMARVPEEDELMRKIEALQRRTRELQQDNLTLRREARLRQVDARASARLAAFPTNNPHPVLGWGREGMKFANMAIRRLASTLESPLEALLPEEHEALIRRCLETGRGASAQATVGGRVLSWAYAPAPADHVVNMYCHDVTRQYRFYEALQDREAKLHMLLAQMPVLLWTVDHDLRITELQGRLQGVPGCGAPGRDLRDLLPDSTDAAPVLRAHRAALGGEPASYDLATHGRIFSCRLEPLYAPDGGAIVGCVGVAHDVTHRRRLEDERLRALEAELDLERTRGELERTRAQVLHADRLATIGTLAGGVGHELNNAASVLLTSSELIQESAEAGESLDPEDLEALFMATEHVRVHARNLLEYGKPSHDLAEQVDLRDLAYRALEMLQRSGKLKQARVTLDLGDAPLVARINPVRVEQVLVNLMDNAADAVEPGGSVRLELRPDRARSRVRGRVLDDGCGVSGELARRVFDPYVTTKDHGTGLGLAVVRGIVVSMGGEVTLRPRQPQGTVVEFDLPLSGSPK